MSRYESGVHEPPFRLVERIAKVLGVSEAYFYCSDDQLAEIIRIYSAASEKNREAMFDWLDNLND